jgi:hypothetical protein
MAMGFEEQLRLLQSGAISPVLQIEDHRTIPLGQQLPGQGGFAAWRGPSSRAAGALARAFASVAPASRQK